MDIKISMEYISSRFENEPNEIWNHLSEKGSKGRFFAPGKLANPTNEGRERGGRKEDHFTFLGNCPPTPPLSRKRGEEKKAMVALLIFIMATLSLWPKRNCLTEEVHLAVTFSKFG